MLRQSTFLFFFIVFVGAVCPHNYLFKDGRSDYSIIVSNEATPSERTAGAELQEYIKQMSGVELPVLSQPSKFGKSIFIGYNDSIGRLAGIERPDDHDDGFVYTTVGDDLFICGGRYRGTMFGVYAFLEQQMGVRWYAPDCTFVPEVESWKLSVVSHKEQPSFLYRNLCTFTGLYNKEWDAHNLLNCGVGGRNKYGPSEFFWESHAMGKLVTSQEFFGSHPEYFCLRNGKRMRGGQLCLSNPDVVELLKERLLKVIRDNPNNWAYDLSPSDNENYCTCSNCQSLERRLGGTSGLVLWVVNQVADAVMKVYPGKMIGMFAYKSTRQPPVGIVPRSNVVIRLCAGICRLHPVTDRENALFVEQYEQWRRLTPNISIWTYRVNFQHYLLTLPNFKTIAADLAFYKQKRALGILEMGQYQSGGGEFSELRDWLTAKLLWDPNKDCDSLICDFINGYYGEAAEEVKAYFDLCQQLQDGKWHLTKSDADVLYHYPDRFINKGLLILGRAGRLAQKDSLLLRRVNRLRMQVLMAKTLRHRVKSAADGTLTELLNLMETEQPYVNEQMQYIAYFQRMGYI